MRELARATNERRLATSDRHSNSDESTDLKSAIGSKALLETRPKRVQWRAAASRRRLSHAAAGRVAALHPHHRPGSAARFQTETWFKKQDVPIISQTPTRAEQVYRYGSLLQGPSCP